MTEQASEPKTNPEKAPRPPRKQAPRQQHVVVEVNGSNFSDAIIYGQELEALRSIVGKPDWRYVTVRHGESIADALKAGRG